MRISDWSSDVCSSDLFLASLASRKRKAIKKERRKVAESGIRLTPLSGRDIEPRHWDAFFEFYMATADRKWGQPYLTRDFFHLLGERLADRTVLMMADYQGELVAGALNLKSSDTLYGRNWGSLGRFRFLHFETCYYRSEEHTSELQSLMRISYAVFCLKKKNHTI